MDNKTEDLIFTAFNLGVIARQEKHFATVKSASNYFYDVIFADLSRQYKDLIDDVLIVSYTDYLTSIAILGYILPYISAYDEDFKNKLVDLILARIRRPKEVIEFEEMQGQVISDSVNKEKSIPIQVY